jgi:hypothetical protein
MDFPTRIVVTVVTFLFMVGDLMAGLYFLNYEVTFHRVLGLAFFVAAFQTGVSREKYGSA